MWFNCRGERTCLLFAPTLDRDLVNYLSIMPPKKQQVKKNYNEDDDGEYTDAGGFGLDLTAEGKSIAAAIRADLLSLEEKFVSLLL